MMTNKNIDKVLIRLGNAISIIKYPENSGAFAPSNLGIDIKSLSLIAFLDAEDAQLHNKLGCYRKLLR
jgi:hypothetical protein